MMDGDISNESPVTFWVLEDLILEVTPAVVITRVEHPAKKPRASKSRWRRTHVEPESVSDALVVNQETVSKLWRFKRDYPEAIIMQLLRFGPHNQDATSILSLLDSLGSPFSQVISYPDQPSAITTLAYRPDVIAVIDTPENVMRWGGRGRTLSDF